jgi:dolichyl-phosphate beta-glucosyltransferase
MLPAFSVVIPAFNEAERIGETLSTTIDYLRITSPQSELIVVNDGSTDGTGDIVRRVFAKEPPMPVRLLEHFPNRGKGAAVREGLLSATKAIAVFFDADLSTPLNQLPKIVEPIAYGDTDLAFGSRALDRTLIGNRQPWRREQGGRVFNLLVRLSTGLPFWDTQCGFKAFRMAVCREIIAAAMVDGFGFDVELLLLAQRAGLRLREIPVRWNHHEGSKVHFVRDSWRMLREVMAVRGHPGSAAEIRRLVRHRTDSQWRA